MDQITPCTCIKFFEPFLIRYFGSMFEPIDLISLAPKHTLIWIRNISEEVYTVAYVVYSRLMYFKPNLSKESLNLASESVCLTFVSTEQHHIVLQADVALAF